MHDHSHDHSGGAPDRRALLRSGLAAGMAASLPGLSWAAAPQVSRDMARAASAWLAQLDERQRREAQLDWSSRQRENWHYVPRGRPGVALRAMSARADGGAPGTCSARCSARAGSIRCAA